MSVVIGISCMSWLHGFYIKMIWLWTCECTTVRKTLSSNTCMISYPTDIATVGQKQLVIVLGSIIGGVAVTTFICFMVLVICCCTALCPLHYAQCTGPTMRVPLWVYPILLGQIVEPVDHMLLYRNAHSLQVEVYNGVSSVQFSSFWFDNPGNAASGGFHAGPGPH